VKTAQGYAVAPAPAQPAPLSCSKGYKHATGYAIISVLS
jgi:hypothetical protein